MKYQIGDIVFASDAIIREEKREVRNHLYVIIDNDGNVVPADYFGFVVSSKTEKSKENSPKYPYNEPIEKNDTNNLKEKSIVKCDQLFNIPNENINKKIGVVDGETMNRFLNAFSNSLINT